MARNESIVSIDVEYMIVSYMILIRILSPYLSSFVSFLCYKFPVLDKSQKHR